MRISSVASHPAGTRKKKPVTKKSAPKVDTEASGFNLKNTISKGYKAVLRQTGNVASVSSNLRIGSRQFRALLGTGLASSLGAAGMYAGLAAAGMRTAGGVGKLVEAGKKKSMSKALDGVKDLGSAAVLGLASASMYALRRTVLPFYGGIGTIRGAFNYAMGRKDKNKRRQEIGALDGIRSLGLTARALKAYSPWFLTAGRVLAPVAGVMQATMGAKKLAHGLRKNINKDELKGVVDIASAVGLTMLLTGVAATPGLAVFSAAQFLYTVYNMNSKVRKFSATVFAGLTNPQEISMELRNQGIDKLEPAGLKAMDGIRNVTDDVKEKINKLSSPFFIGSDEETKWAPGTEARLEIDALEICSMLPGPTTWYRRTWIPVLMTSGKSRKAIWFRGRAMLTFLGLH